MHCVDNKERVDFRKDFVYEKTVLIANPNSSSLFDMIQEERVLKIRPHRLRAHPLGIALLYDSDLKGEALEVFAEEFVSRVSHYIEIACERNNLDFKVFPSVFRNNLRSVIQQTLKRRYFMNKEVTYKEKENDCVRSYHWVDEYSSPDIPSNNSDNLLEKNYVFSPSQFNMIPKEQVKTRSQKETNASIFFMRLVHTINDLAFWKHTKNVCEDYSLVREVVSDTSKFQRLEKLCAPQMYRFLSMERVFGMDIESQRQEGLLAIWAAAKAYEARDFARFTTLARKALHFKFTNLLAYHSATKRRTNKHLVSLGGTTGSDDSFLVKLLDQHTFELWQHEQQALDNLSHIIPSDLELFYGDRILHKDLQKRLDGFPTRTFSPSEINSEVLNLSKGSKQAHYKKRIPLSLFSQDTTLYGNNGLGHKKMEFVEDYNFPHLNEKTLRLDTLDPSQSNFPNRASKDLESLGDLSQAEEYAKELESSLPF